jgi:hypothetical protein
VHLCARPEGPRRLDQGAAGRHVDKNHGAPGPHGGLEIGDCRRVEACVDAAIGYF